MPDGPPRLGLAMAKKFVVGAVLIVLLSATAVASAVLLEVDKSIQVFQEA
ncbi:MAG: hypothetical protein QOJ85_4611, partial [Solirubrobacteraceae bacterium]|nr:hypothetical protein [Solirubrobacteraceae bacterium]